jgi:hypothetical protein
MFYFGFKLIFGWQFNDKEGVFIYVHVCEILSNGQMQFLFFKWDSFVFWWLLLQRIMVVVFSIFIMGDIFHLAMGKWHPKR